MSSNPARTYILFTRDSTQVSITHDAAMHSLLLVDMLDDLPAPITSPIPISEVSGSTLTKIVYWMENAPPHPCTTTGIDPRLTNDDTHVDQAGVVLTPFDEEFFQVTEQVMFEIIMAANYMSIVVLLDKALLVIARMTVGKSAAEIREIFGLTEDFTDEQKRELEGEMAWYNPDGQ